jgi:hypothetical protein
VLRELERLLQRRRTLLVVDESSCVKHYQSLNSRTILNLSKLAAGARVLNGTPITQTAMDYFIPLKCMGELNGWKPLAYRNRFTRLGGFMGRQIVGMRNEDELYEILERCSMRALRKDWDAGHTEPIYIPVHLEMTNKQRVHYREMMDEFFTVVNDMEVSADMVLTQMNKLQQISSCLALGGDQIELIEDAKDNPKIQAVKDILDGGPGKMVVDYTYQASGAILMDQLTKAKLHPANLRGRMKAEEFMLEKTRFNTDSDCHVLVAQEQAACLGHNLSGSEGDRCTRMVFYENSYNLRDRLQMVDRNYHAFADELSVYDLITSPADAAAVAALVAKKTQADLADAILAVARAHLTKRRG